MSSRTDTRLVEPLVDRNPFRGRVYQSQTLPSLEEARPHLPEPILPDHPGWVELYWHAWSKLWSSLSEPPVYSSLIAPYVEPEQADTLSAWDCAFLTQIGVFGRRAFDLSQGLNNFYSKQHVDGYICREINRQDGRDCFDPFDPNGAGPNILAWAEWHRYRQMGDESRIREVFWPLLALHCWFRAYRTWPDGLYWATGMSSAMDNQPRVPDGRLHHRHWSWVDANMQAALNLGRLGLMAAVLQEAEWVVDLAREATTLIATINARLWNIETSFYQDLSPRGEFSPVKSVGAYWGLLEKDLIPKDRRAAFIQHLRDAWTFNLPHRVPSLSADSEGYNSHTGNGWRGAVWSPTNYMLLKGLYAAEQPTLAFEIALNHLTNISAVYQQTGKLWENYAPEAAAPSDPARPAQATWGGLAPIAMLLEDAIGLRVDWPLRRLSWHRYLDTDQAYGVANYPLGQEGTLRLVGDSQKVLVETDVPFTLTIQDRVQSLKLAVPAGTTEIELS